jgi:anti-sigma regulatory factor (Ser/Thr protein kinase)
VRIAAMQEEGEGRPMLRIEVKDSGPGFDHAKVLAIDADLDSPFGRGIPLLKRVCDRLEYHGCGNHVEALFTADSDDEPGEPGGV